MSFGHKKNKFKAVRTNGFASKFENAVHEILLFKQKLGEVRNIKCQQTVVLIPGPPGVRIAWKIDFSCENKEFNWETEYVEAKGVETSDYKLKLKLYKHNPPARLTIYKGSYQRPKVYEIIEKRSV